MEVLENSQEVQAAKSKRKAAKSAVTKVTNILKKDLVLSPGQKYDFSKLDKYSIAADAERTAKYEAELAAKKTVSLKFV